MPWVMIAMTIFGAIQSYQAGQQQEALAEEQAVLADQNAQLQQQELDEQVRRQGKEDSRLRAAARARAGASGARSDSGTISSYLDYMEEEQGRELNWMKTAGASRIRLTLQGDQLRAKAGIMKGQNQQWDALFKGASASAGIASDAGYFS